MFLVDEFNKLEDKYNMLRKNVKNVVTVDDVIGLLLDDDEDIRE